MQKNIITAIILICLVGIISFSYFFLKKKSQNIEYSVYEVIPASSSAIIEIKKVSDALELSRNSFSIWDDLRALPLVSDCNSILGTIDSVISRNNSYKEFLNNSLTISLHQIGKNKFEYVFYIPIDNNISAVDSIISKAYSNFSITNYKTDGYTIHTIQNKASGIPKFSYSVCNNILIACTSRISIENCIKSYSDETNILSSEDFKKVKKTAGDKVIGNLYINVTQLPKFSSIYISNNYKEYASDNATLASWAEYDITLKDNAVLLNGFSSLNYETDYFSIFKQQKPVKLEITDIIPSGINNFISIGYSDKLRIKNNLENYYKKKNVYASHKKLLNETNALFNPENQDPINIIESFYSLFDTESAIVFGNAEGSDKFANTFALFKTNDKALAKENLLAMLDRYCEKTESKIESFITNYGTQTIYKFPTNTIPELVFGNLFRKANGEYVTIIDNYILFGKSILSIQNYINAIQSEKTLTNDEGFKKIQNNLLSTYSFYLYTNVQKSVGFYKEFVNEETQADFDKYNELFSKFNASAIQLSADNNMLYNNIYINFNTTVSNKPQTIWQTYLDSKIICRPKIITTHTNQTYVMVQDATNTLYFINNSGKVEWEKKLDEPIISEIHDVDCFKNGKIQYACNSKNYIYIIDRLGNFVTSYPKKLQNQASAGMSVIDYEKNRDYRIFIPCSNKKIQLLNIKGDVIKDWNPKPTETTVTTPVQHFVTGGKDYIVYSDNFNVYIVNRKGEIRLQVKEQIQKSINNTFIFEQSAGKFPARLITSDINGSVKIIDFQGKVTTFSHKKLSPNHYFDYRDFDEDGSGDFLFIDNNELEILTQKNTQLCTFFFDAPITQKPVIYDFSKNNYKIAVVDNSNSKIYLINTNGSIHKGFPLQGKSFFDIGFLQKNSSTFNLIINGEENFLYNYEIK